MLMNSARAGVRPVAEVEMRGVVVRAGVRRAGFPNMASISAVNELRKS